MSSRFPRSPLRPVARGKAPALVAALAGAAALCALAAFSARPLLAAAPAAPAAPAARDPNLPPVGGRRRVEPPPAPLSPEVRVAYDDSSAAAHSLLLLLRPIYGGVDNWAHMGGLRYYVDYTIPGPDSTTVRQWSESHFVWVHDSPRIRIDNSDDSTIVVVTGDSTFLRQGGEWVTSPDLVRPVREQALDEVWLMRLPWNLLDARLKRRLDAPFTEGQPLAVRVEYGPGLDRPQGTILHLRFEPPSYALRSMHWFDPRTGHWFRMDFFDDGRRYNWTWAGRRVLKSSDADGSDGPVVWTALVQDMQIEPFMPTEVLAPPGGVATVVRPDSSAASAVPSTPAGSAAPGH